MQNLAPNTISVTACSEPFLEVSRPLAGRRRSSSAAQAFSASFQIDAQHHSLDIRSLPFSTRARNILGASQVRILGNLHDTPFTRIRDARNCGAKSFSEILRVLSPYCVKVPSGIPSSVHKAPAVDKPFSIPEQAREWPLKLLPISARLEHVLTRLKMAKLADLHGLNPSVIEGTPDCGVRTATKMRELLGRIQRGEFGRSRQSTGMSPALFLVTRIDEFVSSLPEPRREILCRRLGASEAPWTLMKIGKKFDMTRERVRQIVNLLTDEALRFGGPPMATTLNEMADELLGRALPLTPQLIERRLGASSGKFRQGMAFHARMIELLCPRIPAWPEGPEPAAHRARESEAVLRALTHWVRMKPGPTPFAEVLTGIREGGFTCSPTDFLHALRYTLAFEFDFSDPEKPTVAARIRAMRRWMPGEEAEPTKASASDGQVT